MRILIMGAPGSGKGTQATRISERYGIPAISTGDIFRGMLATETPIANEIRTIMAAGGYVPDTVTNTIVAERLARPDCRDGFLLDGYPRTLHQVGTLDFLLAHDSVTLDGVFALRVDENEVTRRLLVRAQLSGRSDDTEATILIRQRVYAEQTEPLLDAYRRRQLLTDIDARGTVGEVFERITRILDDRGAVAA